MNDDDADCVFLLQQEFLYKNTFSQTTKFVIL